MRECIELFSKEVGGKAHLLQLIKKLDLCLKLESEMDAYYLAFKGGKVELLISNVHSQFEVTIHGSEADLASLFAGEFKLREGIRWGYFTIEDGLFRDLLVLESIFYLSREIPA